MPGWLLLIHQIPPKPSYFRVKIWRRLQRLGAVGIKNSVYALPSSDQALEDFNWVLREIVEGGGDASLVEAHLVEGLSDEQLKEMFRAARDAERPGAGRRRHDRLPFPHRLRGPAAPGLASLSEVQARRRQGRSGLRDRLAPEGRGELLRRARERARGQRPPLPGGRGQARSLR